MTGCVRTWCGLRLAAIVLGAIAGCSKFEQAPATAPATAATPATSATTGAASTASAAPPGAAATDRYDVSRMDFKPGPAVLSSVPHTGPFAQGSSLSLDAAVKPLVPDPVK